MRCMTATVQQKNCVYPVGGFDKGYHNIGWLLFEANRNSLIFEGFDEVSAFFAPAFDVETARKPILNLKRW